MKNNQKGFVVPLLIIVFLVLCVGVYIYFQKIQTTKESTIIPITSNEVQEPVNPQQNQISSTFNNTAGFSFSLPTGWHVWEGASAGTDLMSEPNFSDIMQKGPTTEQLKTFQAFLNNWTVSNAKNVTFTSANVDYKNRDFSYVGNILSTPIDSQDMINNQEINMTFSSQKVASITPKNDSTSEKKNITINGISGVYARFKSYKLVDDIIIEIPINVKGNTITFIFNGFVKKDDSKASDALISFISNLNLKSSN
jgi:hypothetical protein